MDHSKDNIVHGGPVPKYLLDSKSNLSQYFIRLLSEFGNTTSLVDAHDGSSFTTANILNASINIANWLKYECGIKKSDVVGIFSENTIWYPSLLLATWHVGAVCSLFNPMYNDKELIHVLNISKPKVIITSKMGMDIVRNAAKQLHFIKYVVPIDIICNARSLEENSDFLPPTCDNYETCVILFSSGTTGLPKGVEISHRSLFLLSTILNHTDSFLNKHDILMGLVPMFHGYGLLLICLCMSMGNKLIVLKYFEEGLFLKSIQDHKISVLFAVPPLMVFLAKHPLVDKYDLSSLNFVCCGAAPLSPETRNTVAQRVGKDRSMAVEQGYGMTELGILTTYNKKNSVTSSVSSVGTLINGMSGKVIDLINGKTLGINQRGELCFKGPLIMNGYHNNSEETLAVIDSEGWLHTGDVGYYDTNYNFHIVDRIKELIKYKGYQVAPAELESLLLSHPEIADAAVTGLPNLECGELPMAFVVKSPNSSLSEKHIIDFVHKQVSAQKRLRGGVQFVNIIPKNPSGKILRRVLKELINQSKL